MGQRSVLPFLTRLGLIPAMPELPEAPLRAADQVFKTHKKKRGRVAVFTGCSVNYIYPHFGESLINVLQRLDYEVILPKGEVCCGSPLRGLGLEDEAVEQAKKNHGVFSRLKVEAILSLCPTCTMTLKHEYPKMIGKGLDHAMDISTFLIDKLDHTDMIQKKAFYHDPCHLSFGLGITKEPREIIKRAGVELVGPEQSGCCGFGGLFCMSNKKLSADLLESRAATITASGADTVITSCPGCIMQLSRSIKDRPVIHLVELIEDAFYFRGEEQGTLF
jgi:glycolate oxidase iron-sulfur subunit